MRTVEVDGQTERVGHLVRMATLLPGGLAVLVRLLEEVLVAVVAEEDPHHHHLVWSQSVA